VSAAAPLGLACRLAVAALLAAGAAPLAAAERLVDLAPVAVVRLDLRWAPFDANRPPGDAEFARMSAQVPPVEYRLDLTRWIGRNVRVFLVVPTDPGVIAPQGLELRWTGRGPIRNGQGRAGDRVAVYTGLVREPVLADVLDMQVIVDSRYFTGRLRMLPYFELETLQ
jgi:hypothetical protein